MSSELTAWVRLDDAWLHNPKVRKAGLFGRALYLAAICYSHRQNSDGEIDADVIDLLAAEAGLTMEQANEAATRLMEVGLFDRRASGWHVHDYEEAQDTKAERDALRASARLRKSRSRARHAEVTRDSHVSHSGVTLREGEGEGELKRESPLSDDEPNDPEKPESAPVAPPRPNRKRRVGDDFAPDPDRIQWAEIHVPAVDVAAETVKFVDYHQAKGSLFADCQKAWQNWMRRADEYRVRDRADTSSNRRSPSWEFPS